MTLRSRYWLAAALGVCLTHSSGVRAAEPPRLDLRADQALPAVTASDNQRIADAVAQCALPMAQQAAE